MGFHSKKGGYNTMVYIDNNGKLANLLETLLKKKEISNATLTDTKDLIAELRSPRSDVFLVDKSELKKKGY